MSLLQIETETVTNTVRDEVQADPRAFLAKLGIDIDDEMNVSIREKLQAKGATQALTIHIDL